ncbi:hypothetical protein C2845_PM03G35850 [Panicum miliaceum]|uniref:Uncharacterized protein n=1 Tax=Panicum miliaceum TaxID=4540 RepID=A0A3L6T959_PANMI|nr:hypothetical protein C2845_PM03G35850 [Panicum miliaceum]
MVALAKSSGFLRSSETAHSTVIQDVSVPPMSRSCAPKLKRDAFLIIKWPFIIPTPPPPPPRRSRMGDTGGRSAAAAAPSFLPSLRRSAARAGRRKFVRLARTAAAGRPSSPSRSGGRGRLGRRSGRRRRGWPDPAPASVDPASPRLDLPAGAAAGCPLAPGGVCRVGKRRWSYDGVARGGAVAASSRKRCSRWDNGGVLRRGSPCWTLHFGAAVPPHGFF